jgi:Flp pilus assembly protein TadG
MKVRGLFNRLRQDREGAMIVETAIVAPVLVLMSLGAFQVSGIVARQSELQSAAAEGSAIALASAPDTTAKRTTLKNVLVASTGLSADHVAITEVYRCDASTSYTTSASSCSSGDVYSRYVKIVLTDTYTPTWARFGVGSAIHYSVTRYVMYKQQAAH